MSLARINVEMVIDPLPVRLSSDNNPREASLLPHSRNLGYGSLPVALLADLPRLALEHLQVPNFYAQLRSHYIVEI